MRRSAAPSQFNGVSKRPRFNSPYLSTTQDGNSENKRSTSAVLNLISSKTQPTRSVESAVDNQTTSSILPSTSYQGTTNKHPFTTTEANDPETKENRLGMPRTSEKTNNIQVESVPSVSCHPRFNHSFKGPVIHKTDGPAATITNPTPAAHTLEPAANTTVNSSTDGDPRSRYFNVMWCKRSARKHKKWEGDAILITKTRTVKLLDTDGKEIGQGSGYKIKELETLDEGHTLMIGGKEIEVMSIMPEVDYISGRCFSSCTTSAEVTEVPSSLTKSSGVTKPFAKPQRAGQTLPKIQTGFYQLTKSRFDVNADNALVLPRPSQSHQWDENPNQLPIIDVVVDPYLSQHLRPHQREGVVFLYQCVMGMKPYSGKGTILADEMGLGKTLQCISLIWTLLKQGPYGGKPIAKKVIVITPGSLVKNWLREFKKWLGTERIKVFAVTQNNKVQEFIDCPTQPILAISYEMFVRNIESISKLHFDLVICDEGHRLKNANIKTTTLVNSLACRRRVVLTGTPVQNDLVELFSIVDFCNPGILGTASSFRHVYEDPILKSRRPESTPDERTLGETRAIELNRVTSMFILRRTSDINNKYLPPKVDIVLFCQPSPLQMQLYKKLLSSRVFRSCMFTHDMAQHLMCISALRKLCNHPSLLYNKALDIATSTLCDMDQTSENDLYQGLHELYPAEYDPKLSHPSDAGKLVILAGLLEAFHRSNPQERVVLVSNYTQTLDILEVLCKTCKYSWLRLDGQTPTGKRQQLVERFNSKYSTDFVFLLSSKAGGIGLNLIGASRLVLYDVDWNPANDLQAMARVWRDGQRRTVYIYRLLTTGSIEEKMYQRQISKQGLSSVVVDAKPSGSNNQVQFSQEELRDLFCLDESTHCSTHDMLDCQCTGTYREPQGEDAQQIELPERCCQIGQLAKKNRKNLCMDELFQWQHIAGPSPQLPVDPVISETNLENVSFAFYCESNTTMC